MFKFCVNFWRAEISWTAAGALGGDLV